MFIDFLIDVFTESADSDAIVWGNETFSYRSLRASVEYWQNRLPAEIGKSECVSLEADFSPNAVALLLALIDHGCIVVPLTSAVEKDKPRFRETAEVETRIEVTDDDGARFTRTGHTADHEILQSLKKRAHPGLVLFSSGSTGDSKAAVHDFVPLLEKFKTRRHSKRAISFLLFDHIGGVNTLLYNLSNGGCVVTVRDRSPDTVCAAIDDYRVQMLPTSPTFLNLLLLSEAHKRRDLTSLELITYGTEVMPESTLQRVHAALPNVRLLQTYGLSELGILRSKSRSSDSLWVKVGGEGFQTRVVDGLLEIKAQSAMLGYLNAKSPFTEDGWFATGDAVEVDGEYFRFLGRRSEIINVGGEKVYPAEVESVLQTMEAVEDVAVRGIPSPLTGQMIEARFRLRESEQLTAFKQRLREFCRGKLARYKIPQKVVFVDGAMHTERFKKARSG